MVIRSFFLLTALLSFAAASTAQTEYTPSQIEANGTIYESKLSADQSRFKQLSAYFTVSGGKSTTPAEVYVEGPPGIVLTVRTGQLGKRQPSTMFTNAKLWNTTQLMVRDANRATASVRLAGTEGAAVASANAYYHIQRDSCAGRGLTYIVQFLLDMSAVPQSAYDAGFTVRVGTTEYPYKGGQRASIKPSSDGLYRGEPISLFETLSFGNEIMRFVNWKGGKIVKQDTTPVVKYVGYKGIGLSLARIKNFLNGGKATFELTNRINVYSVCFSRTRARQSANGYPAPGS
jgi:hypothetical protein